MALQTIDIWNSAPEPSSGRSSSEPPYASVDDRAGLLEQSDGRRQVVGRVVQHRAAADALELGAHARARSSIDRGPGST